MKLGDILTLQRGNTYKGSLLGLSGPFLLGLASIKPNGGFRDDSLKTYGGESPEKLLLKPGDLYVSLKDVTQSADLLGAISRVPEYIEVGRLTQDTVKLIFVNKAISRSYIYWLLRTPNYREYCRARSTGTTNLGLSRDDFFDFPVPEPTVYRLNLVNLLEDIESKIEVNRRTNVILESMAQAVFHQWFVENKTPNDWEEKSLDEIADFLNGLALQKFPASEDNDYLPVIKIAQLRTNNTENADRASTDIPPQYVIEDGDILFSWSGSLTVVAWCGGKGALNQHLFKVTSEKYPKWFYYYWTKHHLADFQEIAAGKATTMGHIQRHHLRDAKVLVPRDKELKEMDKVMSPILEKIINNEKESRTLASLRDSLLPKLMRGEVRMKL